MEKICPTCGRKLSEVPRPKGGRPSIYCGKACRELNAATSTFLKYIGQVQDIAGPKEWLELRQKMFQALNARAWNRGVPCEIPRGAKGRFVKGRRKRIRLVSVEK